LYSLCFPCPCTSSHDHHDRANPGTSGRTSTSTSGSGGGSGRGSGRGGSGGSGGGGGGSGGSDGGGSGGGQYSRNSPYDYEESVIESTSIPQPRTPKTPEQG